MNTTQIIALALTALIPLLVLVFWVINDPNARPHSRPVRYYRSFYPCNNLAEVQAISKFASESPLVDLVEGSSAGITVRGTQENLDLWWSQAGELEITSAGTYL